MAISGTVYSGSGISGNVSSNSSISGSVSSSSNKVLTTTSVMKRGNVVSISVPGPQGISGDDAIAASLGLSGLADVDISNLVEGSLLMYSLAEGKWKARNDLGSAITLPLQNQDGGTF
jgi:hypothetical protein